METNTQTLPTFSVSSSELSANNAFQEVLHRITTQGVESAPRGLRVRERELENLTINPNMPLIDFAARPFNWKYFTGELAWYITKDTNIDFISNFSNFWSGIADSTGNINSNYGKLLFGEQLQWALDSLKRDPNTRQAVCFVNRPTFQYEGNRDFVCTMYLNFWIRDNRLHMKVQMRSNDVFYGLTYDAPFFAFVQQSMWHWLKDEYPNLDLGNYYHFADNIHYYERHFEVAEQILNEEVKNPYWIHLKKPLFFLKNGYMVLTDTGVNFMEDVAQLVNEMEDLNQSQEDYKNTLNKYFFIQ
jgi:thymidylate synthase